MQQFSRLRTRFASGEGRVSLLVILTILSFMAISVVILSSPNVVESNTHIGPKDNISSARLGLDRMTQLVRRGYMQGAVQASTMPADTTWDSFRADRTSFSGKIQGVSSPLLMSEDWLMVQVPSPEGLAVSSGAKQQVYASRNYVFRIVPDPGRGRPGQPAFFQMQVTEYPSLSGATNSPAKMATGIPVTLISGIVGPLDPKDKTRVAAFQYVGGNGEATDSAQTNLDRATPAGNPSRAKLPTSSSGVTVNLQIYSNDPGRHVTVLPLSTEI